MDIFTEVLSSLYIGFNAIFNFETPYRKELKRIMKRSDKENLNRDLNKLREDYIKAFNKFKAAHENEMAALSDNSYFLKSKWEPNEKQHTFEENRAKLELSHKQPSLKIR